MRVFGEVCLLAALVATGFGALACIVAGGERRGGLARLGTASGWLAALMLTAVLGVLGWALYAKDFSFEYVVQYSSQQLPWHYSLSAVWVGQAGSLLLWAWITAVLALVFSGTRRDVDEVRQTALGIIQGCVFFLVTIMVFAADPMQASVSSPREGVGLSPLLQHPSMLIHPPVVFAGYAAWAIPFALTVAALWHGRRDSDWISSARNWSLIAWVVLGVGILLGADWAYQELGWGGYWGWDPVENGSLIPWLTGTALIHGLMAWRYRQTLKKTTVALAILTFGLCNFATFLTRSGIFSSVHAFSQSPIGWFFLGLMATLLTVGGALIVWRRATLAADRSLRSVWSREALILFSIVLWTSFAAVVTAGTIVAPLSTMISSRTVQFGPGFYNKVLLPVGLTLLSLTAVVPLTRWGRMPGIAQRRWLLVCGTMAAAVATLLGIRGIAGVGGPVVAAVAFTASGAVACLIAAWWLDSNPKRSGPLVGRMAGALVRHRRRYAAYVIHLGFVCLAVGVAGSSLGTFREEFELAEGQTVEWNGRQVRHTRLLQAKWPDRLVAEAVLEVQESNGRVTTVRPARHLHLLQKEWTTEVAIDSTWRGDFYVVLHAGLGEGRIYVSFIWNPLMRWLWLGGAITALATLVALWPQRSRAAQLSLASSPRGRTNTPHQRRRPDARAA